MLVQKKNISDYHLIIDFLSFNAGQHKQEKDEPTPEELQQQIFREKAKQKAKEDREMHEAQV